MTIDREYGSAPAWTNSISYREAESAVSMTSVDAWYNHACGIDENGETYCWGKTDKANWETYQQIEDQVQTLFASVAVNQLQLKYHTAIQLLYSYR